MASISYPVAQNAAAARSCTPQDLAMLLPSSGEECVYAAGAGASAGFDFGFAAWLCSWRRYVKAS
jgi:hypothetical protein